MVPGRRVQQRRGADWNFSSESDRWVFRSDHRQLHSFRQRVRVVGAEYDPTQRAFVIHRTPGTSKLALKLQASSENPIVNPAFVVEHWSGDAKVLINGKAIDANVGGLRKGYLHDIGGDSLILWLPFTSDESVEIQLEPSQTK